MKNKIALVCSKEKDYYDILKFFYSKLDKHFYCVTRIEDMAGRKFSLVIGSWELDDNYYRVEGKEIARMFDLYQRCLARVVK